MLPAPASPAPPMARKVKTIAAALASSSLISTPAWPSVSCADQRHLPLELEEILSSQIVLVRNFFPSKIRTAWKTFLSSSDAIALSPSPPAKRGEAQRTNSRFSVQDAALAAALWTETGLRELVQGAIESTFASCERPGSKPSGLNSNIRVGILVVEAKVKEWTLIYTLRYIGTSPVRTSHITTTNLSS